MKGIVYNGPRDVTVSDVPDPRIDRPGDGIIQVVRTNICGSDLHMYEGRTDMEPGRVLECPVKAYNRYLRDLVHVGRAKPSFLVSHELPLDQAPEGYQHFDARDQGWTKVVLAPAA
jgi:threonine dehydrogenase-like Zn-dependent dehydrogenase